MLLDLAFHFEVTIWCGVPALEALFHDFSLVILFVLRPDDEVGEAQVPKTRCEFLHYLMKEGHARTMGSCGIYLQEGLRNSLSH